MREAIKKHRVDIIIIAAILLLAVLVLSLTLIFRREGGSVEVRINGELYGTYPLSVDRTVEFKNSEGRVTNTLVIEGGTAYLSFADCPDKTCVNTGKIKYVGQRITCLPNRLTVQVVGESDGGVDFVS